MALRLSIENVSNLPDGGPICFTVAGRRSIDIGRDQHLDWTLPDPTRYISGKHCEVHYRNNGYWLHDVSTNGTFLNGSDRRVRSPYQLQQGDRLAIGQYIIAVSIDQDLASASQPEPGGAAKPQHAPYPQLWDFDQEAPPPVDRRQMMSPREAPRPVNSDFLDWAAAVPDADLPPTRPRAPARRPDDADLEWSHGTPSRQQAAAAPPPPIAAPRRPSWKDEAGLGVEKDGLSTEPQRADAVPPPPDPSPQLPAPDLRRKSRAVEAPQIALDGESQEFLHRLARAASLPEDFFATKDPQQLADQLGELMRIAVTSLMSLLHARNEAKRLTRSSSHTTIQATENNPLKFSPTPEDAMRILFGPKTHSYMDARRAFEQGFDDLKLHQLKTYAAMQHAVSMLIRDLDPAAIARDVEAQEGMLDRLRPRKRRLWDAFVTRWKISFGKESAAAIGLFMRHFAEYYDQHERNAR
jgi:type VI secretion system protein ImpI